MICPGCGERCGCTESREYAGRRVRRYVCSSHGPFYTEEQLVQERIGRRALWLVRRLADGKAGTVRTEGAING